ncbi:MAG: LPS export ABC transporter periplasmic protein LptC [Nitratireductor sp.]
MHSAHGPGPETTGREEAAFLKARRYSRRVRVVKLALPLVGAALSIGFFGYSYVLSPSSVSIGIGGTAVRDGKLVMANPKVSGYTQDNLPYTLTAIRAIQDLSETGTIQLEDIDAKFPVDENNWARVLARTGTYDDTGNTLDITSPVTFKTTDGMTANLKSAFINIEAGELSTSEPVDILQDGSRVTADTFKVLDKGKVFVFEKRVRVMIEPQNRADQAPREEAEAGN